MKIALVSRPRTRTSAIIRYLSKCYNTSIQGEIYGKDSTFLSRKLYKSFNRTPQQQASDLEVLLKETTDELFLEPDYVLKIWTEYLYCPPQSISANENFDEIKARTIFDVSNVWQLHNYEKIYYVDRDHLSSIYSYVYAKKTNKFIYSKPNPTIDEVLLDEKDLDAARFYIYHIVLQNKLKDYLNYKGIEFTEFSDFDLLQNVKNIYDPKIDYPVIIKNSKLISDVYNQFYPYCLDITKSWQFY